MRPREPDSAWKCPETCRREHQERGERRRRVGVADGLVSRFAAVPSGATYTVSRTPEQIVLIRR